MRMTCGQRRKADPNWHMGYAVSLLEDEQLDRARDSIINAYNSHCGSGWQMLAALRFVDHERYLRKGLRHRMPNNI